MWIFGWKIMSMKGPCIAMASNGTRAWWTAGQPELMVILWNTSSSSQPDTLCNNAPASSVRICRYCYNTLNIHCVICQCITLNQITVTNYSASNTESWMCIPMYIPRNICMVHISLYSFWFGTGGFYPYPLGLLHWHWAIIRLPQCQWSNLEEYG